MLLPRPSPCLAAIPPLPAGEQDLHVLRPWLTKGELDGVDGNSEDEEDGVGDFSGDGGDPVGEGSLVALHGRVALHEAVWGTLLSAEELPVSKYEKGSQH